MLNLNAYLIFDGTCKAALEFYEKALDGKILSLKTVGESPMDAPAEQHERVIHAEFDLHGSLIMASDTMESSPTIGNNVHLSILMNDVEKARIYFDQLAAAGKITAPLEPSFWGDTFGMLTDKFGINWMINVLNKE